jgi:beta-galactosidase
MGAAHYYRSTGWYRRHFMLGPETASKSVYLQFDGANIIPTCGSTGPRWDSIAAVAPLRRDCGHAARCGQRHRGAGEQCAADNVAPLNADFTFFGGLYRDRMMVTTRSMSIPRITSEGVWSRPT